MDKIEELKQRLNSISLGISRVPAETKTEFIYLANAKFSGDYGMTLKFILEQALEYQMFKKIQDEMNSKLDYLISKLDNVPKQEEQKPTKEIKLLDGRRIEVKREVQK